MKNKTKTWKIGEYAKGGVITVEVTEKSVTVICKDWDFSKGSHKGSDQSNAEELSRHVIDVDENNAYRKLLDVLCDLTTSYYGEEITEWVESQVKLKEDLW